MTWKGMVTTLQWQPAQINCYVEKLRFLMPNFRVLPIIKISEERWAGCACHISPSALFLSKSLTMIEMLMSGGGDGEF
jgi:hypothetical protein